LLIGLTWLVLGCQVPEELTGRSAATAGVSNQAPQAVFVDARDTLRVRAGQPVKIDSYFASRNRLGRLEIFVNDQPVRSELLSGQANTFAEHLATVQVLVNGSPVITNPVQAKYPNATWDVSLLWTAHTPGAYTLSLQVTDNAQLKGRRITQRIEVQ
jgi:cyanophycinase-like exopeptidase